MTVAEIAQSYELRDERLQETPKEWVRCEVDVSAEPRADLQDCLNYLRFNVPVWMFRAPDMVVCSVQPVRVTITRGESLYFAESENVGIFVTGDTPGLAIEAFEEQVVHFYNHFNSVGLDEVTGEACRLKKLYSKYFRQLDK